MANPASGPLSFNANLRGPLTTRYGGPAPYSISSYYRGGSYVNTTSTTPYILNAILERGFPQPFPVLSTNFSRLTVTTRYAQGTLLFLDGQVFDFSGLYVQNTPITQYYYWSGQTVGITQSFNVPMNLNPSFGGPYGSSTNFLYYVQDVGSGGQPSSPFPKGASYIANNSGNQTNLPAYSNDTYYEYYGLSRVLSQEAQTVIANTTVPASGEVKMSDYYLQGN